MDSRRRSPSVSAWRRRREGGSGGKAEGEEAEEKEAVNCLQPYRLCYYRPVPTALPPYFPDNDITAGKSMNWRRRSWATSSAAFFPAMNA
jgi:hypothetical protein